MKADRETKEKLIASAKSEFLEKGYTKASLRKICANAGVTTGALYFFFDGKESLFRAIVERPLEDLIQIMEAHFTQDEQSALNLAMYEHQEGDHNEIAQRLIHHLYIHYDAFILLLTKSQGTCFENSVDQIVEMTEKSYRIMAEGIAEQTPGMRVNDYIMHWLTHMTIDAFVHLLTHEREEQRAQQQMRMIMDYIVKGWMEMILIPKEDAGDYRQAHTK